MNTWIKSTFGLVFIAGAMLLFAAGCDEYRTYRYLEYGRNDPYYVSSPYRVEYYPAFQGRIVAPTRRRDHARGRTKGTLGSRRAQRSPSRRFQYVTPRTGQVRRGNVSTQARGRELSSRQLRSVTPRTGQARRGNLKERRTVSTRLRNKRLVDSIRNKQLSSRQFRSDTSRRRRSRRGNSRSNLSTVNQKRRRPRGARTTFTRRRK